MITRFCRPTYALRLKADVRSVRIDVRFGSKADIGASVRYVRFTPESGHTAGCTKCPLSAKSGHWPTSIRSGGVAVKHVPGNALDKSISVLQAVCTVLMTPRTLTVICAVRAAPRRAPGHPGNTHCRSAPTFPGLGSRDETVCPGGDRKPLSKVEPTKADDPGENNDSQLLRHGHWAPPLLKFFGNALIIP